ncbi:hypothetical protein ACWFMI_23800 [Nocardiopsis terrae]
MDLFSLAVLGGLVVIVVALAVAFIKAAGVFRALLRTTARR